MGSEEVTMETKYAALFASVQAGQESVTELYARLGISRKSYYKYLARFASEGLEGLRSRSGAQAREAPGSPSTTSAVRRRAVPMQPSLRLMHDRFRSPAAAFSGRSGSAMMACPRARDRPARTGRPPSSAQG